MKAAAWMDDFNKASNPLDSIHPESGNRLAWTYVLVGWDDGSESWETRTQLRRFLGAKIADKLIYKRAARQLTKYNQHNGLDAPEIDNLSTPSRIGSHTAPALSTAPGDSDNGKSEVMSRRSRTTSKKSGGRAKVTFEADTAGAKAVTQEQFHGLETKLERMATLIEKITAGK